MRSAMKNSSFLIYVTVFCYFVSHYHSVAENHNHHSHSSDHLNKGQDVSQCTISLKKEEDTVVLTCQVESNSTEVYFLWTLDGEMFTENVESKGLESSLTLNNSADYFGKYKCFANNIIGQSIPCEIDITTASDWIRGAMDPDASTNSEEKASVIPPIIIILLGLILSAFIAVLLVRRAKQLNQKHRTPVPSSNGRSLLELAEKSP